MPLFLQFNDFAMALGGGMRSGMGDVVMKLDVVYSERGFITFSYL